MRLLFFDNEVVTMRIIVILLAAVAAMVFIAGCPKGNIRIDDSSSSAPAASIHQSRGVLTVDLDTAPMQYCLWYVGGMWSLDKVDFDLTIPLRGNSVIRIKHKLTINEKAERGLLVFTVDAMSLNSLQRNADGGWTKVVTTSARDVSTEDYFIVEFDVPSGADMLLLYPGEDDILLIKP